MDWPCFGRDDAGKRAVRGSAERRRRAVQRHQQNQPRVGEKDTDQGHELSADGEHPTVRVENFN